MFMPMRGVEGFLQLVGEGDVFDDELGELEAEGGEGGLERGGGSFRRGRPRWRSGRGRRVSLAAKVSVMRATMVLRSWSSRSETW